MKGSRWVVELTEDEARLIPFLLQFPHFRDSFDSIIENQRTSSIFVSRVESQVESVAFLSETVERIDEFIGEEETFRRIL